MLATVTRSGELLLPARSPHSLPPRPAALRIRSRVARMATSGLPKIMETRSGRITPTGTITEFAIPTPFSGPEGITTGPDGNLWFTESDGNKIGRLSVSSSGLTITPATTLPAITDTLAVDSHAAPCWPAGSATDRLSWNGCRRGERPDRQLSKRWCDSWLRPQPVRRRWHSIRWCQPLAHRGQLHRHGQHRHPSTK